MDNLIFNSWRELTKLGYFELLDDGRLKLIVNGLDGLIDFHTHLGWTFLFVPPIDFKAKSLEVKHNFTPELKVDLNIYSGQNLYNERPRWVAQDYYACSFLPFLKGKHHTHTAPNIIFEMDALKIDKSVCLCIDMARFSNNSDRAAELLKDEPRLVFYCSVSPKKKNAEKLMEKYVTMGAKGMKIHPEIQLIPINSPLLLKHLRNWVKISSGLPVLFHSGFNGYEPKWARKNAKIELYHSAAEALEPAPCILGHSAMNEYKKAIEIAKAHSNVYLEVSGQPPEHIKDMLNQIGDDRLLFGSDWPVYPQAMPMAKILVATEDAPQSRIKILRDNALKLINICL